MGYAKKVQRSLAKGDYTTLKIFFSVHVSSANSMAVLNRATPPEKGNELYLYRVVRAVVGISAVLVSGVRQRKLFRWAFIGYNPDTA